MNELITIAPPPLPAAAPAKPRVWTAFVAFGILLAAEVLVAVVVLAVLTLALHGPKNLAREIQATAASAPGLLTSFVATMALVAGMALVCAWLSPQRWRDRLQLCKVPLKFSTLFACTLGIVSVGAILSALMELHWLPPSKSLELLDRALQTLSPPLAVLAVLLLGVLPGLCEELFFRGYVQTRLVARWGAAWGIGVTALMFGISHLDVMQGAFAAVVGCLLGLITVRSGSIIPAMICHTLNNTLSGVFSVAVGDGASLPPSAHYGMLCAGLVVLPLAILHLRARLPPAKVAA